MKKIPKSLIMAQSSVNAHRRINKIERRSETIVYIKFPTPPNSDFDIAGFLNCRMSREIPFEVVGLEQDIVVSKFSSKSLASRAIYLLKKSNRSSETKLICTIDIKDIKRTGHRNSQHVQESLDSQVEKIYRLAYSTRAGHDTKITQATSQLADIQAQLKKFVSIDDFESLRGEEAALSDRVEELELQRREFQSYLGDLKMLLFKLGKSGKEMFELRKHFGIECCRLERALPMYARRKDIVETVKNNQVSIILGETGSGKSTQLTQYLYQTGFADKGQIACTQPRKIAATSLATHVASEMVTNVGKLVGYQVGMRTKKSADTKIIYMTDHVLLNEYLKDNLLSAYSCLIIDEAHERTIFTDLLLGMIKSCARNRPELKIIITSATINPDIFVKYFNGCPVLKVSGRTFPVEVLWKAESNDEPFTNYVMNAVNKAIEIHKEQPEGDILVFMTSPAETERACETFKQQTTKTNFQCMQLHGRLQANEQQLVFEPLKQGERKIVFATNSAETSVTIPNIKYVIDTGVVKEMRFDPKKNINLLDITMVTQSSAEQRKGRAGRTAPGVCYRLYTENDYSEMLQNSKPEILRVNLCQALLKLYELGVDPLSFNFVESPSSESIEVALNTLRRLHAVEHGLITDMGRWLAKMPVAPSLGHMIWHGMMFGVTLEAIVVASGCSTGGNPFYRGSTDAEKKKSDKCKTKFLHDRGDLLTLLYAYREWDKHPEKSKNKWCVDNSINAKTMRFIRDTANEIVNILQRDFKEEIKHEWCEAEKADIQMQKIIILCYSHNLCHYLGNVKAGYVSLERKQHLHVHPGSSLVAMALQPEWVVFEQTMKTSRNFAMAVTPVPEGILRAFIDKGVIELDIESARTMNLTPIFSVGLGRSVFKDFVGPCFSSLKSLDVRIQSECGGCLTVLEAERELGTVRLLCMGRGNGVPNALIECEIEKSKTKIAKMDVEQDVSRSADFRVVLGSGGQVKHVLAAYDFRSIIVKCEAENINDISKEDVEKHFDVFGDIISCSAEQNRKDAITWGKLRFRSPESADRAVKESCSTQPIWACADTSNRIDSKFNKFPFKSNISWCRRRSKGFCFITLANPEDMSRLYTRSIVICGSILTVQVSKKREAELFIPKLPLDATEENVKEAICMLLGYNQNDTKTVQVVIPRHPADVAHENVSHHRNDIASRISRLIPDENFDLKLRDPKPKDFYYTGFVLFRNIDECNSVCRAMDQQMIGNSVLHMTMSLTMSVIVMAFIYKAVKSEIDTLKEVLRNSSQETRITEKVLKNGNVVIDLRTNRSNTMANYMTVIHEIVDGELMEANERKNFHLLFTSNATKHLRDIEDESGALIHVDRRNICIRIYGKADIRQKAVGEMNKYLDLLEQEMSQSLNLNKKAGLLKALVSKYGVDLATFVAETNVTSAEIDFRGHNLRLTGSKSSLEHSVNVISTLESSINLDSVQPNDELPDCVVCFCPIEKNDLYRLECCGHPYCQECARRQFRAAVTDRSFPVLCCFENCGAEWLWCDISYFIRLGVSTLREVTETSISAFVRENKDTYSYCITPDCPSIFRRSHDEALFQCKDCGARVCTKCCIQYHDGMTCAVYKSMKTDTGLRDWCQEDPTKRKICPNCTTGIEKIDGCNNMTCIACKGHICWVCLEYFKTNQECYGHLEKKHGGFV